MHLFGDCLEQMNSIPDHSVDMVLCDLPYGTTRNKWDVRIDLDSLWQAYKRVCTPQAASALTAIQPFTSMFVMSNLSEFRYEWIWEKSNAVGFLNAARAPLRCHESILLFSQKRTLYNPQKTAGHLIKRVKASYADHGPTYNKSQSVRAPYESTERFPRDVLKFPKDNRMKKLHPTQKPVALMEYLIRTYTKEGMRVLDNCMGSGTTGIACLATGRKFIGIENDRNMFDLAVDRIQSKTLALASLAVTL